MWAELRPLPAFSYGRRVALPGCGGEDFLQSVPPAGCSAAISGTAESNIATFAGNTRVWKFDGAQDSDSFITHRNMRENFERIRKSGLSAYQAELDEKVAILEELLEQYNDGRKKFLCLAVNLLELQDVRELMAQLKQEEKPGNTVKENAAVAVRLFEDMAKSGIWN